MTRRDDHFLVRLARKLFVTEDHWDRVNRAQDESGIVRSHERNNQEFREMTDAELDEAFRELGAAPAPLFTDRAVYVLDERLRRVEAKIAGLNRKPEA